jgi:hypothetical protein
MCLAKRGTRRSAAAEVASADPMRGVIAHAALKWLRGRRHIYLMVWVFGTFTPTTIHHILWANQKRQFGILLF